MNTKSCTRCDQVKSVNDFYRLARAKDGLQYHCKVCQKGHQAARYSDPAIKWGKRDARLKSQYGITAQEYDNMSDAQEGLCAICEKPNESGNLLSVDHSHVTGEVRGLLCQSCNLGVGKFFDNPSLLRKAADYLG